MSGLITAAVKRLIVLLASAMGASMLGFLQSGVGAVLRSIQDRLRESVHVTDFMTPAEIAASKDEANHSVNHTAAFKKALAVAGVVRAAPGYYNVNLELDENNLSILGEGYNRVRLRPFTDDICVAVAQKANVSGLRMKNIRIDGSPTGIGGIKLGSDDFYCAIPIFEHVNVWEYSRTLPLAGYGIQLYKVQNATFHNCWIYRNRYGYHRPNAGYCTSLKVSGKSGYAGGGFVGFYFDGFTDDAYLDDFVGESNTGSSVIVTENAVRHDRGSNIYINGAYKEANGSVSGAAIVVTGGPGPYQQHVVVLDRIYFAANHEPYVIFDRVIATVRNCKLTPRQVRTTADCSVHFEANKYPTGSNFLVEYREKLGNITVRDFVDAALPNQPNQINLLNALMFPENARHVDDPYTLDDYREFVLGQSSPIASGFAGTINRLEWRHTKVGRIVTISYLIDGTNLKSDWTSSALTIPYRALGPATLTLFNASTGQTMGSCYIDPSLDRVLLPTWAPITGVVVVTGLFMANE